MTIWQPRLKADARVKYIAIVEALEEDIKARLVKPGDRLPPQRQMAATLGVDLTTVTRAVNEAVKRGLAETLRGSGTFIAQTTYSNYNSIHVTDGKKIDLSMNNPPHPSSINLEQEVADTLNQLSQSGAVSLNHLYYQETAGHPDDREAGALWLSGRLNDINSDLILIASGAHSALFSILSHFKRSGFKTIAAPELCYPGLRTIADYLGLQVCSVAMDKDGVLPLDLQNTIEQYQPDAFYCIPNIDNPTTATIPTERRKQIVKIARRADIKIIEDDPYYVFLDKLLPSLYSLAPELTWHIATVSKCLSPALRVAYVAAPDLDEALSLAEEMRISSIMAPPLMAAVVTSWIKSNYITCIADAIKQENNRRQLIAAPFFEAKHVQTYSSAPHFWLNLPKGGRALEFSERASLVGVSVVPSTAFVSTKSRSQALRISLGVASDDLSLRQGLSILADLHRSKQPPLKSIV